MIRTLLHTVRAALISVMLLPIAIYRRVLSPLKGAPSCRFLPTCSEYAATALRERGIVVGGALATWRVLRCNPLCRAGYDPVPGSRTPDRSPVRAEQGSATPWSESPPLGGCAHCAEDNT